MELSPRSCRQDNSLARGFSKCRVMFRAKTKLSGQGAGAPGRPSEYTSKEVSYRLRFDHCNHASYYECTRLLLQPILDSVNIEYLTCGGIVVENTCDIMRDKIDRWYRDVVEALTKAASASVPRVKNGTLKHFWDDDLNELKKLSINSHNLWVEADTGKPRSGYISKPDSGQI